MGPLIPFVISEEFGFLLAILIGFAFGFILEQAGFSSTKKLVGLFYGYDFTVLRVFFTAGVTAMTGVLLLAHYDLLDLNVIYVNPTFTRSAIAGGLIMGAGFIIGGFCPGTSVCAAFVGKLDAMLFIIGSIVGVYIFIEWYPSLKDFYMADALGPVLINEQLGMSKPLFAFLMTLMALFAFVATWYIQNKVTGKPNLVDPRWKRPYMLGMIVPLVLIAIVAFVPGKQDIIKYRISEAKRQQKCVFYEISADKLAYEIVNHYYRINIIDVRSPEEYAEFHIPMAINIPFDQIMEREWAHLFKQKNKVNVFYADADTLVRMACLKAKYIGKSSNMVLTEHARLFRQMYYELERPMPEAPKSEFEAYHYRSQHALMMENLLQSLQNIGKPVQKEIRQVRGGCS